MRPRNCVVAAAVAYAAAVIVSVGFGLGYEAALKRNGVDERRP